MAALIALGTNQPHQGVGGPALLRQAIAALEEAGVVPVKRSHAWLTPPWPPGGVQPDYHNAVILADAQGLDPETLFSRLAAIERRFGRVRAARWGPRTLDLDLIAVDALTGRFGDIVLPHPRMHERAFVLAPLAEVAPGWVHPGLGEAVEALLARVPQAELCRRGGALD